MEVDGSLRGINRVSRNTKEVCGGINNVRGL
jgi:hypothetical protein